MLVDSGSGEPNEEAMVENSEITAGHRLVATRSGISATSRDALLNCLRAPTSSTARTRVGRAPLQRHRIAVNGRLRALHEHNEASLCDQVVAQVASGQTVVVISDAGTPGISDPGARWPRRSPTLVSSSRPPPDRRRSWRRSR